MRGEINSRYNAAKVRCLSAALPRSGVSSLPGNNEDAMHAHKPAWDPACRRLLGGLFELLFRRNQVVRSYGTSISVLLCTSHRQILWLWLPTSEFIGFQITAFRAARPNENRANLKHAADVRKSLIANGQMSGVIPLRNHVQNIYCCAVWPIKCRQGSKTNKSNCQFWKKLTFDWLVESPSQGLFGQRPQ